MSNYTLRTKVYGVDLDAKLWAQNALKNGGVVSLDTLQKVSTFVQNLKNAGVWNKILDCGIFAGGNLNAALTKLKSPAGVPIYLTNNNFVAGDYVERGTSGGLQGNGTNKYLNVKFGPKSFISQNSTHLSVYCKTDGAEATTRGLIGISSTNPRFCIAVLSGGEILPVLNQTAVDLTGPSVSKLGHILTSRIASNINNVILNGVVENTFTSASTSPTSEQDITVFARGSVEFTNRLMSFYSIGNGLTETESINFYNAVQSFQQSLNRSV